MSDAIIKALGKGIADQDGQQWALERIEELEAALDSEHAAVGSNIWRFWSHKAMEVSSNNQELRIKNAELGAKLAKALAGLQHYACESDCCECEPHEKGQSAWCGFPARTLISDLKGGDA